MSRVLLLNYGAGNIRSAAKALERAGMTVQVSADPTDVAGADALVIPGQGHFRQVMEAFEESGFHAPVMQAAQSGKPILGICVGMQLLFTNSEEAPGVSGLNLIPGTVKKFQPAPDLKVPQMGWNALERRGQSPILHGLGPDAYAYFVHSYYVPLDTPIQNGAVTRFGVPFWSALSHGNIHATQFHPEKSGEVGLHILRQFGQLVGGQEGVMSGRKS